MDKPEDRLNPCYTDAMTMSILSLHYDYHERAVALQGADGDGFADESRRGLGHGVLAGEAGFCWEPDRKMGWVHEVHVLSEVAPVRSRAARAAHREQARSYICCGPVNPEAEVRATLVPTWILRGTNKAVARVGAGNTGPKQM